ncbi:hypothetical protein DT076_01025 [Desertihabitans brevis]|uniref:Zinc-ribbon domain-containing protein n=1 Tax=Desertihabitans brevis TaxID=2268447 RepID=A0A367YYU2_9ACTN|nr:hypothetical protein [Desertihabitans brevis]RCK71085.1 hypothetical protein DT076_01025 [Desertihabitans brevis]
MIFFFGTRVRRKLLESGSFRCPYCLEPRGYERLGVRTWIHVFWIPVIPLGSGQEEVRCRFCQNGWAPKVLEGTRLD